MTKQMCVGETAVCSSRWEDLDFPWRSFLQLDYMCAHVWLMFTECNTVLCLSLQGKMQRGLSSGLLLNTYNSVGIFLTLELTFGITQFISPLSKWSTSNFHFSRIIFHLPWIHLQADCGDAASSIKLSLQTHTPAFCLRSTAWLLQLDPSCWTPAAGPSVFTASLGLIWSFGRLAVSSSSLDSFTLKNSNSKNKYTLK